MTEIYPIVGDKINDFKHDLQVHIEYGLLYSVACRLWAPLSFQFNNLHDIPITL